MKEKENWLTLDEHEVQMPWYTRPCLEWLDKINLTGKYVFEYGVGYSSLWYLSRGAYIYGVDNVKKWADMAGVECIETREEYLNEINHHCLLNIKFDIVCIDGEWRDECTQIALKRVRKGGYVIIDNYRQATADLEHWPITETLIRGMNTRLYKEPCHLDWATLVIYV